MRFIFILFNYLYKYAYWVYRPVYFFYKKWSDRDKIAYLKNTIRKGDVVLDIGANIGFYSCLFSELVGPSGKVYAFEPDERNFQLLLENTSKYKNIECHEVAVGDKAEIIRLYHSSDLNVDHQTYDSGEGRNYREVRQVCLDELLKTERVNFIKIDIQGYDYYAMKGMSSLINNQQKIQILGELWPYGLKKAQSSFQKYIDLIQSLGLTISYFDANHAELLRHQESNLNFYTDYKAYK